MKDTTRTGIELAIAQTRHKIAKLQEENKLLVEAEFPDESLNKYINNITTIMNYRRAIANLRKLVSAFVLFFLFICVSAAQSAETKKPCTATTKAGTACKNTAQAPSEYCRIHNPATPKCSATTKAGSSCRIAVKTAGERCHRHKKER